MLQADKTAQSGALLARIKCDQGFVTAKRPRATSRVAGCRRPTNAPTLTKFDECQIVGVSYSNGGDEGVDVSVAIADATQESAYPWP